MRQHRASGVTSNQLRHLMISFGKHSNRGRKAGIFCGTILDDWRCAMAILQKRQDLYVATALGRKGARLMPRRQAGSTGRRTSTRLVGRGLGRAGSTWSAPLNRGRQEEGLSHLGGIPSHVPVAGWAALHFCWHVLQLHRNASMLLCSLPPFTAEVSLVRCGRAGTRAFSGPYLHYPAKHYACSSPTRLHLGIPSSYLANEN